MLRRDHHCELPSQVPRILNAGIHALRTDRAVDVRGIAGQEHAALAISRGLTVMQTKKRVSHAGSRRVTEPYVGSETINCSSASDNVLVATSEPSSTARCPAASMAMTRQVLGCPSGKNMANPRPTPNA